MNINELNNGIVNLNTKYKVAVCISGMLRNYKDTYQYLNKYVIEPLNADVFIYGITTDNIRGEDINVYKNIKNVILTSETKGVVLEKYHLNNPTQSNVHNVVQMYYNISQCNELKKQYEVSNDFEYDIVIRCRFDQFYFKSLDNSILDLAAGGQIFIPVEWNFKEVSPFAYCDMFAVGDSVVMDGYSDLYNALEKISDECIFHPESLNGYNFLKNKISVTDMTRIFMYEYPDDWNIPAGYDIHNYRKSFN